MRRRTAVVTALGALAAAWAVAAPHTPPLYDGIGTDEPYRYVAPPAGYQKTAPPTSATDTVPVSHGTFGPVGVASGEVGPQVSVYLYHARGLRLPAGATALTLIATPQAATTQPADGTVWGNVYHVAATTPQGQATLRAAGGTGGLVELRSPHPPPPTPVMEFDGGSGWRRIHTARIGNDIFAGPLIAFGDYAVVIPTHPIGTGGSGGGVPVGLVAIVVALVLLVAAVLGIRLSRVRSADRLPPDRQDGSPQVDH